MTFDKEEHRVLLLKMIDSTNFPGAILELILELKRAVEAAKVEVIVVNEGE